MALYRGERGAVFDIDLEGLRPNQRETHEAMLAAGTLTRVDSPDPETPPAAKKATAKKAATPPPPGVAAVAAGGLPAKTGDDG